MKGIKILSTKFLSLAVIGTCFNFLFCLPEIAQEEEGKKSVECCFRRHKELPSIINDIKRLRFLKNFKSQCMLCKQQKTVFD